MQCQEVERLLPDYSVGLLKPRQETAIVSHLDGCPECRREWRALQGVGKLVKEFAAIEPPAGLWNGIYNRIVEEAPEPLAPSFWRHIWGPPARVLGAAAAMLVLIVTLLWNGGLMDFSPNPADHELAPAMQEHALASADGLFADRAGLETLAALGSQQTPAANR